MWYVIQVNSGNEHEIKDLLEAMKPADLSCECFIPLYEEVRRSGGKCRILFKKLFPGYVFIETDDVKGVFAVLREVPEFTKLLGGVEADGSKNFIPIGDGDEAFMRTLFEDGLMHVSYVHMTKNGRIDRITGPLANYKNHITKLEMRHRMAIVEAEMFGKKRKVRFGLWTDEDPKLPYLEKMKSGFGVAGSAGSSDGLNADGDVLDGAGAFDIGIYPGDEVVDESGIYVDQIFKVVSVDPVHRTIESSFEILGTSARIELRADDVCKLSDQIH